MSLATEQKINVMTAEDRQQLLEHIAVLSSDEFSGRKFSSEASIKSQTYLIDTLKNLAIPAFNNHYRHPFFQDSLFQSRQGANIIALIPGSHFPDEYIVLSAHYDHLGRKQNRIFNGADDNASGTAALLLYGKRLIKNPLHYSVILLFTDGEEANLLGAKAFAAEQKNLLRKVKLNINLDMIAGSNQTRKLRFISKKLDNILSKEALQDFKALQAKLKEESFVKLTHGFRSSRIGGSSISKTDWRMASDHGVFYRAGIPFIYFGVGDHKNYHSESDDFSNINQPFFISATQSIYQQIIFLDKTMLSNPAINTD